MNSSDSEEDFIQDAANAAISEIIPEKSRKLYEKRYKIFCEWMAKNNKTEVNETLLLAFFNSELKNAAPTTKWSIFSILKAMLKAKMNVDIGTYHQLISFLKKRARDTNQSSQTSCKRLKYFVLLQRLTIWNFWMQKLCSLLAYQAPVESTN